jgi:hypothetical protein
MKHAARSIKEAGLGASRETEMVSIVTPDARFLLIAMIINDVGTETGGPANIADMHRAYSTYAAEKGMNFPPKERIWMLIQMLHGYDILVGGVSTWGRHIIGRKADSDKVCRSLLSL